MKGHLHVGLAGANLFNVLVVSETTPIRSSSPPSQMHNSWFAGVVFSFLSMSVQDILCCHFFSRSRTLCLFFYLSLPIRQGKEQSAERSCPY